MSISISEIQEPIKQELEEFEIKFRASMRTRVMLLDRIMTYIVKRKGKQMRPMFVFLSARLFGNITDATHRGAALIELLHTATLVHDDVVDDSEYRRGFFSINALWKNKIAVLVGDFLLSKGLLLAIENSDFESLRIVSKAVKDMSEGELLQMEKARRLDIDEAIYFEVIRQKTASLIASCCAVGASSAGATEAQVKEMHRFGELVGMAFQIKDDLFDYETAEVIGKPVGIDIRERKMTLPLIYALNKADWIEKRKIIFIIKNQTHKSEKIKEVMAFVRNSGGVEYAKTKMRSILEEARAVLQAQFPEEQAVSLLNLVDYTILREK
jgi:octaprenyl-diphosphate synthase